ncbi:MAG: TauD/TfdA family dioxygenase [Alphaproteobacteria bacterium]|nr:TauD/TfdA family dioxygenase [Alphaproteobacteria bacterium]MCB9930080.1 TauD/TfdA family dioxygenase [Alphaproteobacteria bacterium]
MDIIPSGKALGAEVRGIDLSQPWTAERTAAVRQAWSEHLVLLFRGQSLGDEHLLAMAEAFGGQQSTGSRAYWLQAGYGTESGRVSALPGISIISNLDETGKPVFKGSGSGSQELLWHTDNSYVDNPPAGSILHALRVPVNGGGHTSFANQYLAYEHLPEATKARIAGLHTRQDASRNTSGGARPTKTLPQTYAEVEGPVHPLVRVHPETGRKALYLGRRYAAPSSHILELPNAEGEALLDELWAAATRPEIGWTQEDWQPGDVLMWDNRCTLHARTQVDPTQARVLHRTLIKGELPIAA